MAITSENKGFKFLHYLSAQVRYALTYVLITTVVLAFLNLYCATENELLFRQNKLNTLTQHANLIAAEISSQHVDRAFADSVISHMEIDPECVLITDEHGNVQYAANDDAASSMPFDLTTPGTATRVYWDYHDGVMTAAVSVPVRRNDRVVGCVYLLEIDSNDGTLLKTLHRNILTITVCLELGVILFSVIYVRRYSHRLKKIMHSMRIIQNGDYSHKIEMPGHDELAFLAAEFNYLTERLQTSEKKRQQFVSDASHELKTPLASIRLLSDSILQYDMDMSTVREFAGDIGNEADRLTRMTNKLLALTRDETDATDDAEIIYMSPTVERVAKMLQAIAAQNQIRLELDLRQDSTVLIREDDLYQITYNLVENGIKYNVAGGKLSVSLHRQEGMAILRVSDTGVGIPPEALSHVFERFYRVDKARSRQSGGSGLGLSIVRSMVERNSGEIHLQSTVGKGTVFTVAFPCFDISEEEIDLLSSEDSQ